MLQIGIIGLPCVVMGLAFLYAIQGAYHSHRPTRPLFLYPLICSFVLTSGFMIWGYQAICTSRSSTAAIGSLFLPFEAIVVAVAGVVISWSVLYVAHCVIQRINGIRVGLTSVVCLTLAIALLALTGYVVQNKVARRRLLSEAATGTDVVSLEGILASSIVSHDNEVLSKLAKNPNTPITYLVRLYDFCKPNVGKSNPSEYPIFHALAHNPRTPPEILSVLAGCQDSSTKLAVVTNPSTPTRTLRQLAEGQDEFVRGYAKRELRSRERKGNSLGH
jgi:hypothetical protein